MLQSSVGDGQPEVTTPISLFKHWIMLCCVVCTYCVAIFVQNLRTTWKPYNKMNNALINRESWHLNLVEVHDHVWWYS